MPPKTARKSTLSPSSSGPVKKGRRRLVRLSELNGDKNDDAKDLSKVVETTQSQKLTAEEKSKDKRDPINETKKEPLEEPEKEINEIKAEKSNEKIASSEREEEGNGENLEDEVQEEEEYEPEEETTAVDYEPEENHEDEYIEEEIEEEYPEEVEEIEEEPLENENPTRTSDRLDDEISNHNSEPLEDETLSEDNLSLSGDEDEEEEEDEEQNKVVNEHRKRKEFEVFVGGLDKDATENDLKKAFSEAGEITEIRLLVNPITKKNKGFAFLRFATVEQAKRVVRDFKSPVICGRRCGVAASHDNDTLFVGNICKTWTKEHLKETLKVYGVDNFKDLKLVDDPHNEGMNRGFAFLEFSSRDEALDVLKRLQKRDVNLGTDRVPKVAFSDSFKELDDEIMSKVTTCFIDNLPPAWDEDKIRKHLKKYGSIEKIELARNMPFAKRRDFGFVTFDTHDNAIACINGVSGIELDEGDKVVMLKARLSRPTKKEHRPRRISMSYPVRSIPSRMDRIRPPYPRGPPLPPPRRPGPPPRGPRHFGSPLPRATLRVAPMSSGSRIVRRVVSTGLDRRALVTVSERPPPRFRAPPPPARSRPERLPPPPPLPPSRRPVPAYPKGSMKRDRGDRDRGERDYSSRHEELLPPPPPPSRRPRNTYEDVYSTRGPPPPPPPAAYSDIAPRGMSSRNSDRRPFVMDDYGGGSSSRKHDDRGPTERGPRGGRDYDAIYGTKRPYSDVDDGSREAIRNSRTRLDYSQGGPVGNNYTDSYGDRMGRGPAGYGGAGSSRNALYGGRQGMSYPRGSGRGNDMEDVYSPSLGGSYMSRGPDGGGPYPTVYSNRGMGGGAGSSSYY